MCLCVKWEAEGNSRSKRAVYTILPCSPFLHWKSCISPLCLRKTETKVPRSGFALLHWVQPKRLWSLEKAFLNLSQELLSNARLGMLKIYSLEDTFSKTYNLHVILLTCLRLLANTLLAFWSCLYTIFQLMRNEKLFLVMTRGNGIAGLWWDRPI